MNKIIEYEVAVGDGDYKELNKRVANLIQHGFQPFGGISTAVENENVYYAQAMVRYGNKEQVGAAVG